MNSAQVSSVQDNGIQLTTLNQPNGLAGLPAGRLVHSFSPEALGFKVEFELKGNEKQDPVKRD